MGNKKTQSYSEQYRREAVARSAPSVAGQDSPGKTRAWWPTSLASMSIKSTTGERSLKSYPKDSLKPSMEWISLRKPPKKSTDLNRKSNN